MSCLVPAIPCYGCLYCILLWVIVLPLSGIIVQVISNNFLNKVNEITTMDLQMTPTVQYK